MQRVTTVRPDPIIQSLENGRSFDDGPADSCGPDPATDPETPSDGDIIRSVMAWCDGFRIPSVMTRRDGAVLWCNEAARSLLAEREHFCVRGDKLVPADPVQENGFRAFIEHDRPDLTTWIAPCETDMLIVVREVLAGGEDLRGLTFHRTSPGEPHVWADFGPVMGLTGSETRIAQKLIEGGRADSVASEAGIGMETVRTHIRRIYNKLGINSREELFSRLSPFRIR